MTEKLFCHPMVEIGHRDPMAAGIPTASRTKSMDMWMKSCRLAEGLDDGDHAGPEAFLLESRGAHELSYRLVSATRELAQKLAVMEKVDSQHLWDRKNPHGMRNVLEQFIGEKRGESGGSFGVARRTDAPLATGEQEEPLGAAGVTSKSCEATFRRRAVEVAGRHGVGEASPPSVGLLETVLPERLDVVVMCLDQLK